MTKTQQIYLDTIDASNHNFETAVGCLRDGAYLTATGYTDDDRSNKGEQSPITFSFKRFAIMKLFRMMFKNENLNKVLSSDEILYPTEKQAKQAVKEAEEHGLSAYTEQVEIEDNKLYFLGDHPTDGPIYTLKIEK